MNKVSISTVNGTSKLIYNGMVVAYLDEFDLDALRSDIWVALLEIDLAKQRSKEYEEEGVLNW